MVTRYLVTGGAGFIGSNIVDRLVRDANDEVIVIDDFSTGKRANLAHLADSIQLIDSVLERLAKLVEIVDGLVEAQG